MSAVSSVNSQALGTDQFLKLFTAQATMQDPMNPVETNDFLAQLAQFTSLEQLSNLNTNFEKLLTVQQSLQAGALVGKTVTYIDPETGYAEQGRVTAVRLTASGPVLMVGNKQVPISQLITIAETPADGQTASTTQPDTNPLL